MMDLPLLCIADDFTGATDLSSELAATGLRVVQMFGRPPEDQDPQSLAHEADAVVVALKIRTVDRDTAVAEALAALTWLTDLGPGTVLFKYCSTFDSTDHGNIGPIHDALTDTMRVDQSLNSCAGTPPK